MKRDAHYYAVLAFCRACGFKKSSAQVVAYASQLVDDAKTDLIFVNGAPLVQHDLIDGKPAFFDMATCHAYYRINTFNYEAMTKNTIAFHFVPGGEGKSYTKRLRCKEEAPIVLNILKDALKEDDLIKLGIVLHVYADTFSHQGFSGMLSKVNDIKDCKVKSRLYLGSVERFVRVISQLSQEEFDRQFDRLLPAYGHVQALHFPDTPYLIWSYEYDESHEFEGLYKKVGVDNRDRYKRAFNNIRKYLENYLALHNRHLDRSVEFKNFNTLLKTLIFEGSDSQRERNWQNVLVKQGLFVKADRDILIYKDNQWAKEAFANYNARRFNNRVVEGAELNSNFANSHWYRFYLAVKWYKDKFLYYCAKHQLNIPT